VHLVGLLLFGCATESTPLGGPEDKNPPELKAANPPDKTINFKGNKIELEFNEFIQNTGFGQTIISPATQEKPNITANRKKLTLTIKGELQPNTTYTINFGDDIKDVNQGNLLSNFTYVFSTGNFIDSQTVNGKVTIAEDGSPADGFIVSLYPEDSVNGILNGKPLYFTKTNSSGLYKIENIKAGRYRVFALKDQNFNYLYDQPNEQIAFANETLDLTDSLPKQLDLVAFKEKKNSLKLISVKSLEPGKALIVYSAPVKSLKLSGPLVDEGYKLIEYASKDSIIVWFSNYYTKNAVLFLTANDTLLDTMRLELKVMSKDSASLVKTNLLLTENQPIKTDKSFGANNFGNVQTLYGSLKINFTRPVIEINNSKELLIIDSVMQKTEKIEFRLDEKTGMFIEFNFPRKEKTTYTLVVPDSIFKDIFGFWNKKTLWNFKTNSKEDYGNIHLKLSIADVSKTYLVSLLNGSNEIVKTFTVHNTNTFQENLTNIPSGNYHITVLEDTNANGEWDTGDFKLKIQPEKYIPVKDTYTLKGGWDLDVEVKF
jgi:uncharacterized protein (DUF2141 family)